MRCCEINLQVYDVCLTSVRCAFIVGVCLCKCLCVHELVCVRAGVVGVVKLNVRLQTYLLR